MQMSKPKVEARMANISTATVYFPGVLLYAGINEIQTAKNISILNVINLASLNVSGSFRPKKARMKQRQERRPM